MGSMIICESLSLVVVWTSGVLSQDTSPSSLGDGLSRGHNSRGPLGGPVFRQERGVQRKPSQHLLFCRGLRLKIITVSERHAWGAVS